MEYHEAANRLFELRQFRPKPGTKSTRDLLEFLDNPHDGVDYVQIAGSNGKGSTARMLESILTANGQSVGLYTSPHFDDIRERFRIGHRLIPKSAITTFVEQVDGYLTQRAAAGDPVTFFEATTAMALWYFGTEAVDVGVLEVGIGGRFDATGVVDPVASAVTTVSKEHTEILGETIEEIARDKAHVAPRNAPLVTAATGAGLRAIEQRVGELHQERKTSLSPDSQLCRVGTEDADVTVSYHGRTNHTESAISVVGDSWSVETTIPLLGSHQAKNAGIAAAVARELGPIDEHTIARGLRGATWPGRFEVMGTEPLVVIDGAHNPEACAELATVLDEFSIDRLLLVVGAMHEKDHLAMAEALPTPDLAIACRPMRDRAEDPTALAAVFETVGAGAVDTVYPVEAAVERALDAATENDLVLVTGSLFTVAEARQRWTRTTIPKTVRTSADAERALQAANVDLDESPRAINAGVHRVVKTRVHRRQARWLEEELRARGGACATAGLDDTVEEPVDVVLMGTRDHFVDLLTAMQDAPAGLGVLAEDLENVLAGTPARPGGPFPWADRPSIMGILNVTPDSFHDGGEYTRVEDAVARAKAMVAAGAAIIDIGGESTRPGASPIDPATERDRILPVIEKLADLNAMISVDTQKASVARAALEAGADMINDVSGLRDPDMRFVAATYDVPIVVMHSLDTPVVPDHAVEYDDVVEDVITELREGVLLAEQAGLDRSQIIIDPGLGFGKSATESFELLGRIGELRGLGCPIMVGHSHKSMFDGIDRHADDRFPATLAGTAIAAQAGADIIRVHDVAENVDVVSTVLETSGLE